MKTKKNASRQEGLIKHFSRIFQKHKKIILLLFVVLVGCLGFLLGSGGGDERNWTALPKTTLGDACPVGQLDNELQFGENNKCDYKAHNFRCDTIGCDKSRKTYVYVSSSVTNMTLGIEFDLQSVKNKSNVLSIGVTSLNDLCRKNNVYVDGMLVGNMNKEKGGSLRTVFTFDVIPTKDRIHVKISHTSLPDDCWWGNDVEYARLD